VTRRLLDFLGTFDVRRTIEDARSGQTAIFEGRMSLTGDGNTASYEETGHLLTNGQRFAAQRRYIWQTTGDGIAVLFEDGRAFHDFDPEQGGQASEHQCGEDMYRGGYGFSNWPSWSVTWDVVGPRKDYRSVTWMTLRKG